MKRTYISPLTAVCPLQGERLLYVTSIEEGTGGGVTAKRVMMDYFESDEAFWDEDRGFDDARYVRLKSLWDE